jgi:hypothetical protein
VNDQPMNGAPVEEEVLPALPEAQTAPKPDPNAVIDAQLGPIVGVMVRGIMSGASGVPAGLILNAIARQTGKMLALSVVGNPVDQVAKARRDFADSFRDGLAKVSILQAGNLPQQPPPRG